jgi:hypothetical protein
VGKDYVLVKMKISQLPCLPSSSTPSAVYNIVEGKVLVITDKRQKKFSMFNNYENELLSPFLTKETVQYFKKLIHLQLI